MPDPSQDGMEAILERVRLQKLLSGRREVGDFRGEDCDAIERGETAFPKQSLRKQNIAERYSRTLLERTAARRSTLGYRDQG